MAKFDVVDFAGKKIAEEELSDAVFATEVRPYLLNEVVNWQRASARAGTQAALTKGEVSGTTKKPFPQKGRGVARQGSLRNPHQIGGGVAFAPKPRDYSFSMPKSKRRAALASALSARVQEGRFRLINELSFPEPKTSRVVELLKNFNFETCLLVDEDNQSAFLSARNHASVKFLRDDGVNVADILRYPFVVMTVKAAKSLEKRLLA
jgi:large subunit ribosomal protein L4